MLAFATTLPPTAGLDCSGWLCKRSCWALLGSAQQALLTGESRIGLCVNDASTSGYLASPVAPVAHPLIFCEFAGAGDSCCCRFVSFPLAHALPCKFRTAASKLAVLRAVITIPRLGPMCFAFVGSATYCRWLPCPSPCPWLFPFRPGLSLLCHRSNLRPRRRARSVVLPVLLLLVATALEPVDVVLLVSLVCLSS